MSGGLVDRTVELCRALRERGLGVTTSHAVDALVKRRTPLSELRR